jgi:hypothetical protein
MPAAHSLRAYPHLPRDAPMGEDLIGVSKWPMAVSMARRL